MRRPPRSRAAWIACLGAAWAAAAARGEVARVSTEPDSGITIEIEGWAGIGTPATGREVGLVPLEVTITNASPAAHAWTIGPDRRFGTARRPLPTTTIRVPAGGTGRTTLHPLVDDRGSVMLAVQGHGVVGGAGLVNVAASPHPPTGPEMAAWRRHNVGLSKRVLAARANAAAAGFVPLDMERAPGDWRGWSAFRKILMTADEWRALPAGAQKAAVDWAMLGGHVVVLATEEDESIPDLRPAGPGRIVVARWDGKVLDDPTADRLGDGPEEIGALLGGYRRPSQDLPMHSFPGRANATDAWSPGFATLAAIFGPRTLPVGAILVFLAVFGIVAGPLNVMLLAGPGRRSRMFWTTPAISLAATALLLGLMFLRDGVGGSGARRVLALLDPDRATMAVIQEQFSRTGVLLGSSFPVREPSWMIPLTDVAGDDPLVEADDAMRSGGWFRSRSDQAYLVEAVRPSRARIEFVPRADATGLPAVVSSVEVPLDRVFVVDDEGRHWQASDVGTGERKQLQPADAEEYATWFGNLLVDAGPVRRRALQAVRGSRGHAFAESDRPAKVAVETLPSIRWTDDRAVIVCPTRRGGGR